MAAFHAAVTGSPAARREAKPRLILNNPRSNSRSQSEPGILVPGRRYLPLSGPPIPMKPPDLMPQGKAINVGGKPRPPAAGTSKPDIASKVHTELLANEEDERYQYLLKHGNIKKIEDDDKILYAELPQIPGVLVVYRKPSERIANPERLNLDRRDLAHLPLLEGEEKLRLLNFQHNFISKIENLVSLPNLIFLDLYSNQIKEISGLHTVPTLRVLMLGKNLIEKIKNIQLLTKLDVLDLHSNQIEKIESLGHLTELRVLNLANNQIAVIENLDGLVALTELNLRRNRIETIAGLERIPALQRLFLSNNNIQDLESAAGLRVCSALAELALDGNPVAALSVYLQSIATLCPSLRVIDAKKVAKDTKEPAKALTVQQSIAPAPLPVANQASLVAIQKEWREEIERLRAKGLNSFRRRKEVPAESLVQTGNAELENESHLFLYGNSLEVLQKSDFKTSVHEITFKYLRFDLISQQFSLTELRKFPTLRKITLSDNNLHSFTALAKLETLTGLSSLSLENNDVSHSVLCRSFVIYRFPGVHEVSNVQVSEADRVKARQQFQQFDQVLSGSCLYTFKVQANREDKDGQKVCRLKMKQNADFAASYIASVLTSALGAAGKRDWLGREWQGATGKVVKTTTAELILPKSVNEASIRL